MSVQILAVDAAVAKASQVAEGRRFWPVVLSADLLKWTLCLHMSEIKITSDALS